jgi:hypothetical protein
MASVATEAGAVTGDVSSLDAVGQLRLWVTDEVTTADLLDRIAISVGGYWRIDSSGKIQAGTLAAPDTPTLTLRDHQIIDISREATGAGQNGLPVGRVLVECDPIERTQDSLAGGVSEARRARLSKAVREAEASDASTLSRHPLADDVQIASRLATRDQGKALASRILSLLSPRRDILTITARVQDAGGLVTGSTIRIVTPRLGYSAGRNLLVVGREIDTSRNRQTLELWG